MNGKEIGRMTGVDRIGDDYRELLAAIKADVARARVRASRVVNAELIKLYWAIGHRILDSQRAEGWGTKVIPRLSADLRTEFPGMRGFGSRNLVYMRSFADRYPDPIAQEPLAQLPWSHITVLLDKVPERDICDWYAAQHVEHGWSAAVLRHHIITGRHLRVGRAPNNFPQVLPPAISDQTREIVQDPYILDFLALDPNHTERELEDALVHRLSRFLAELGTGFAYVGRQFKVTVGDSDYLIDLLFYHLRLRAFVVFELKAAVAQPEHIGKLNFYVNVVDEHLRDLDHGDRPTIGILLAADRDGVAVEYAIRGMTTPLAVSTYRALPDDIRPALPSSAELADIVHDARRDITKTPRDPEK